MKKYISLWEYRNRIYIKTMIKIKYSNFITNNKKKQEKNKIDRD